MPGVNIFIKEDIGSQSESLQNRLHETRTLDFHFVKTFHSDHECVVNGIFFEGYPHLSWKSDDRLYVLEGEIYYFGEEDVKEEAEKLANLISSEHLDKNKIDDWLFSHDGEFVLYVYDFVKKKVFVQNSAYAHLPVYCLQLSGQVVITREQRTLFKALGYTEFDPLGLAQYLFHGYPLGTRCLYKNVLRLEPSNLIIVDVPQAESKVIPINPMNMGDKFHGDKNVKTNAQNLVELLHENVKWLPHNFPNHQVGLSLSGGLDSRLVAAALKNMNVPFTGLTFPDKLKLESDDQPDVKYAEEITRTLDVPWDYCRLTHPTGQDAIKMLDVTFGMVYFGLSFIMPFYRYLGENYGRKLLYTTGETGLNLRDSRPHRPLKNLDELTEYLLRNKSKIDIEDIGRITNISSEEIIGELRAHLEGRSILCLRNRENVTKPSGKTMLSEAAHL